MEPCKFKKLPDILKELPLGEEKYIGIYGLGNHTKCLLERYQADVGEINAKIIFIDSNKRSLTEKYNGCDIYNVHDIGELPLDMIILSSYVYERDMYDILQRLYGNKFEVYKFYEWGQDEIFEIEGSIIAPPIESRKTLKIQFVDFWKAFNRDINYIIAALYSRYRVEISDEPDILFFSHFGQEHKKYQNCIKIYVVSEVCCLNFADFDYAIGFYNVEDKRNCHFNGYAPRTIKRINFIQNRNRFSDFSLAKRKFCNFVYSNEKWGEGTAIRKQFCIDLSRYKHIDCPGKVLNNMQNAISARFDENWEESKEAFLGKYKFTIAFENHMVDGYTTEKLWGPLRAGSIPIYWGNPSIGKEVDSEAFINCNDFANDFDAVIQRVKEIDADDEYYMYMLQKSPLKASYDPGFENMKNFLDEIIAEIK